MSILYQINKFLTSFFDFFKIYFNEFLSYFVLEKIQYEIKGHCRQCGKCCNYMYSYDTYTEQEFKILQMIFPQYKRFYIKGKDELGNLIFACKFVTSDGKCSVYDKRLSMCKKYPLKKVSFFPKLHQGCGYYSNPKLFKDYLK